MSSVAPDAVVNNHNSAQFSWAEASAQHGALFPSRSWTAAISVTAPLVIVLTLTYLAAAYRPVRIPSQC